MNAHPIAKPPAQAARSFTAIWTEELGAAIANAAPATTYPMRLVGEECQSVVDAVNQGIDAHLEACYVPDRGDNFMFPTSTEVNGNTSAARLECAVSPQSLGVLVRRLLESGNTVAESLAASICQSLSIELV